MQGKDEGGSGAINFQASDANRDAELGLPQPPEAPTEKAMEGFFKEVAQIKVLPAGSTWGCLRLPDRLRAAVADDAVSALLHTAP